MRFRVKGNYFATAQDAVTYAREKAKATPGYVVCVPIWDNKRKMFIAIVTDDANGLILHRLNTWPEDQECSCI